MKKQKVNKGDLFQIHPHSEKFGGQIICCEEVREWGIVGYLYMENALDSACRALPNGRAYTRVKWESLEPIGHLKWMLEWEVEDEN